MLCTEKDKPHSKHVLQVCPVDRVLVLRRGLMLLPVQLQVKPQVEPQVEPIERSGMSDGPRPVWLVAPGLRYRPLPHINSAFQKSHKFGVHVARRLVWRSTVVTRTPSVNPQWIFGEGVLVTTVIERSG